MTRRAAASSFDGGTPTRTGTVGPSCVGTTYPAALASSEGLFPNQILTAYGIAPLQAGGLRGQGIRLAIVGEAPTPTSDVNQFRNCFGAQGTSLKIHNGSGIKPILESSLDAMVVSMVAPQLDRFDLWVQPIGENSDDANVLGFLKMLAAPLQATTNGAPLPNVVSVSYGSCESNVSPVLRVAHAGRAARWRPRRRSGSPSWSPPATPAHPPAPAASRRAS